MIAEQQGCGNEGRAVYRGIVASWIALIPREGSRMPAAVVRPAGRGSTAAAAASSSIITTARRVVIRVEPAIVGSSKRRSSRIVIAIPRMIPILGSTDGTTAASAAVVLSGWMEVYWRHS